MKNLKTYKLFESEIELTPEQEEFLNKGTYAVGQWMLDDGVVNVIGNFYCYDMGLTDFKGIQFGTISGDFNCQRNKLTSLEGSPKYVGGVFSCENNRLTSLKGGPERVEKSYWCDYNKIVSLDGAPKHVGSNFWADHNPIGEFTLMEIYQIMVRDKCSYYEALKTVCHQYPKTHHVKYHLKLEDLGLLIKFLPPSNEADPDILECAREYLFSNPKDKFDFVSVIRKNHPKLYDELSKRMSDDSLEITRDLGELGF